MPKRSTLKLTKRIVEKLEAKDKDAIYRDRERNRVNSGGRMPQHPRHRSRWIARLVFVPPSRDALDGGK